jgi:hypothetical protein
VFNFFECSVRKLKGSETEEIVELHMSLSHRTHFLKYVCKVDFFLKDAGVNENIWWNHSVALF